MYVNKQMAVTAAIAISLAFATPGLAQVNTSDQRPAAPGTAGNLNDRQAVPTTQSEAPTRIGRSNRRPNRDTAPAAPTAPTPEEVVAAAQVQAQAANTACQVTQASLLGMDAEQKPIYEAACATGPGYIFVAATPPTAADCVQLTSSAIISRERDPAADVGLQCTLPTNSDILPVISKYAQDAAVACTVDQGLAIGVNDASNRIYEVGCAGQDGYWLEQTGTTFTKTECIQVVNQNGKCRFTTPQEQAATLKTWLAGSPAAACDVQQVRYMGGNANGSFYEAKCAAGDGYVARLNAEKAVQQTYPCTEAQRIGGGCTLTQVPAAPAAAAPTPAPAE